MKVSRGPRSAHVSAKPLTVVHAMSSISRPHVAYLDKDPTQQRLRFERILPIDLP